MSEHSFWFNPSDTCAVKVFGEKKRVTDTNISSPYQVKLLLGRKIFTLEQDILA